MVNTRAKGNRNQRNAIKILEDQGWWVAKVEVGGKFVKEKDMYGLFDISAIKETECLWIQITTNTPHTHKNYIEFSKKYKIPGITYKQMVYYDRKGWKIFTYKNGLKTTEDLRK